MIQEEKLLLLKDLCARLPYGLKVKYTIPTLLVSIRNDRDGIKVITGGTYNGHIYNIKDVKPYLRPMSSMTEEEEKEYHSLCYSEWCSYKDGWDYHNTISSIDWLLEHHFDFRGLIDKGLALEAPEGMYK